MCHHALYNDYRYYIAPSCTISWNDGFLHLRVILIFSTWRLLSLEKTFLVDVLDPSRRYHHCLKRRAQTRTVCWSVSQWLLMPFCELHRWSELVVCGRILALKLCIHIVVDVYCSRKVGREKIQTADHHPSQSLNSVDRSRAVLATILRHVT